MGDHLWRDSFDEMLEASAHGLHPLMERADLARPDERPVGKSPPELGPLVPLWLDCSVRTTEQKTNRQATFRKKTMVY